MPDKDRRGVSCQYREDVSFRHRLFPEPYSFSKWAVMRRDFQSHSDSVIQVRRVRRFQDEDSPKKFKEHPSSSV